MVQIAFGVKSIGLLIVLLIIPIIVVSACGISIITKYPTSQIPKDIFIAIHVMSWVFLAFLLLFAYYFQIKFDIEYKRKATQKRAPDHFEPTDLPISQPRYNSVTEIPLLNTSSARRSQSTTLQQQQTETLSSSSTSKQTSPPPMDKS